MTTAEAAKDYVQEVWTCVGFQWDRTDNKLFLGWRDELGKVRWYKKATPGAKPGYRYDVNVKRSEDGSVSLVTTGALGPSYKDADGGSDDERAAWAMESRAAEAERTRHNARKRQDAEGDEMHRLLKPLRDAYWNSPRASRTAMLAAVIADITGHD